MDSVRMLSAGLVLMNSAGKIEPGWRPDELQAKNAFVPPRLVVDLISRGLFLCAIDTFRQELTHFWRRVTQNQTGRMRALEVEHRPRPCLEEAELDVQLGA